MSKHNKAVGTHTKGAILKGKCFCEAVVYEVEDAFEYAMNCHCSVCRRATGSAYKAMAGIKLDALSVTGGGDNLMIYGGAVDHDVRCRTCGSFLYSLVRDGQYVHVSMGTLMDEPSLKPTRHIYVGSKAPWHTITDDLPQFDEL
ncbi:GFA family protein [Kordiimonas sp.]|uniref:GFA family protein n=1 Tax=Kordiimonas sp. TaxID=1970157 RepID=UPI003A926C0B